MLKAIETDNVIKNIIREIMRECSAKGIKTTDTLAAYLIRLLVANPDYGFIDNKDKPLQREDVEKLVSLCVGKLAERNSPSLASIKMQVYFETNFPPRPVLIAENREAVATRVSPLIREIVDTFSNTKEDLDKLYRKMIVSIILSSGLGNPTIYPVLKEATVALQSVFPSSELGQFMSLTRKEKEQQMTELTQIVTGIRLFNRDCHKGGEGIEDLPQMLQQALTATQETLQSSLKKLMMRTNILSAAVEKIVKGMTRSKQQEEDDDDEEEDEEEREERNQSKKEEEKNKNQVKAALVTARQLEVFVRKLLSSATYSRESVAELLGQLQTRLLQIHDTVRFRTAIPTVQVYPQFIDLSEIWTSLQDEMVLLSIINNISWSLQTFSPVLDFVPVSVMKTLVDDTAIITDAERIEATTGDQIQWSEEMECEVIKPHQIPDFDDLHLQYLGFCPWVLVCGNGALIPANPNMGVCRWKDKYYAFSSVEAGLEFCLNPDWYMVKALTIARKQPELIELLQLHEQVDAVKMQGDMLEKESESIMTSEIEVQTELHPVPTFIDPEYTWNVWELKRQAIQFANISKCTTRSTQTIRSNFRRSVYIQASPDKTKGTQTKRDSATNVPTLLNYMFGLRGRTDDKQRMITLTRPVHE